MSNKTDDIPIFCRKIDGFINGLGRAIAWLISLLVINIIVQVFMRYALGEGKIWLEEMQWHLYSICIMFAIPYCIVSDAHVRLDLLHHKFSPVKKEYVEFFGILFFILPLISILLMHGLDFVESAWRVNEKSAHPLGLPWRWMIKSVIPVSMFLIIAASVSRMVRSAAIILRKNRVKGG